VYDPVPHYFHAHNINYIVAGSYKFGVLILTQAQTVIKTLCEISTDLRTTGKVYAGTEQRRKGPGIHPGLMFIVRVHGAASMTA
jgi:hypothetical protein